MGLFETIGNGIIETVYPRTCAGCGMRGMWLCESCAETTIMTRTPVTCMRCGSPEIDGRCGCDELPQAIDTAMALAAYEGWVRASVRGVKYHHERARAEYLGTLMAPLLPSFGRVDALVPVPVHPERMAERGYNQAELLARAISQQMGVPVADLLLKSRMTVSQTRLSGGGRQQNVIGAFALKSDLAVRSGGHLVLIDDVRTTGATLGACAAALAPIQPGAIHAFTLAIDFTAPDLRRLRRMKAEGFRPSVRVP